MRLVSLKCNQCGADLEIDLDKIAAHCPYCGQKLMIDLNGLDKIMEAREKTAREKIKQEEETKREQIKADSHKQDTKSHSVTMIACIAAMLILCGLCAFMGYRTGTKKVVEMPDSSIHTSFTDAILLEATEKMDLIVLEQDMSVSSTITKDGLFSLDVFKKNQDVTYYGKAIYTVNLKQLRESDITVNEDRKTVTIYVPNPEVYDLIVDPDDCTVGDTEKGLLSFGDLKMTLSEAFYIESNAMDSLEELAEDADQMKKATNAADAQLDELFTKTVNAIDPDYRVIIEFY